MLLFRGMKYGGFDGYDVRWREEKSRVTQDHMLEA